MQYASTVNLLLRDMMTPRIPGNEQERLFELHSFSLLDTLPEEDYDYITQLASQICQTPIALITLVDHKRQWFKSAHGFNVKETPREYSFCAHAINTPQEIMVVPDSREDQRFFDHPFVAAGPKLVFYAGVPLVSNNGLALGTLCVADLKPNNLSPEQLHALKALSNNVVKLFELRKNKIELERVQAELERKNKELARFASMAAHDLKTPLANISSIINLLEAEHSRDLSQEAKDLIGLMDESSAQLRELIDGILSYSQSDLLLQKNREEVKLPQFYAHVVSLIDHAQHYKIEYPTQPVTIWANKQALTQILLNLITNGIFYNDKEEVKITLGFIDNARFYHFSVSDNGQGIPPEHHQSVFNLFERLDTEKHEEVKGHGIGLSTVKKLVENQGGEISLQSIVGVGTKISFSLPK